MAIRFGKQPPPASYAIVPGDDAVLDCLFAAPRLAYPGQSGVRLVSAGTEAFALRALSARAATRSLDLQYYIWHDDATGRYLANEALAAADRGVRVRLLLDDMDARRRDDVLIALDQHPYIEIRVFNPFRTRSGLLRTLGEVFSRGSRLNHRMHNKAWIADGRLALVGGRNIGDEYFSASDGVNFIDLDVLLAGGAVDETSSSFDAYWNSWSSVPITRLRTGRNRMSLKELRGLLADSVRAQANEGYASQLRQSPEISSLIQGDYALLWGAPVEVVADDPRKAIKRAADLGPGVLDSLRLAFRTTQRQLLLISPYFVPGAGGVAGLSGLVEAGKQVDVLTNSLAATDVAAVHSGYARYRKALLSGGVRIYELKPAPEVLEHEKMRLRFVGSSRASLHTKAAIIDGERVFVGSFNLDPRSATLNCEMGVWVRSQVLARQLGELFASGASAQHSLTVDLDERDRVRWTERVQGRTVQYYREPHASLGRRAAVWLLQFLPIESQL